MRTLLTLFILLITTQSHAAPQGRWAGSTTVAGWPTIFTVVEFSDSGGDISMLQTNLLEQPMTGFTSVGDTFNFDLEVQGKRYHFAGSGDDVLTGFVTLPPEQGTQPGTFRWTRYPPVASMAGAVSYSGTLEINGVASIDMVIEYARDAAGRIHADISIPTQKLIGYPMQVQSETTEEVALLLASTSPALITLPFGEEAVLANFQQGGFKVDLPLVLDSDPVRFFKRPQDPQPPFPYESREVLVNHPAGHVLAGTLTVPRGPGPHPAVILITGSGLQDRNEEILGHRPFLVLSDHLTRNGIAVLRADDRGVGGSIMPDPGTLRNATTKDLATDTSVLLDHLKTQPGIDPDRIGLVGHSEGGVIGPLIADQRDDVAFLVLMAGPARPGAELLPDQAAALMRVAEVDEAVIAKVAAQHELVMRLIAEGATKKEIREPIRTLSILQLAAMEMDIEVDDTFVDNAVEQGTLPWLRWFLVHDPAPVLARLDMPVFAISGSLDLQVPPATELLLIERTMTDAGGDVTTKLYPGLNHLFQPATTGAVEEYSEIDITIDPQVLSDMSAWINERMDRDE
ncbi:MAG: alpha/beta fold hydrolase [Phycisphaerales bacterium]|nr:alpha/beta fold hydrolase [Phycisphaerales bacterium]